MRVGTAENVFLDNNLADLRTHFKKNAGRPLFGDDFLRQSFLISIVAWKQTCTLKFEMNIKTDGVEEVPPTRTLLFFWGGLMSVRFQLCNYSGLPRPSNLAFEIWTVKLWGFGRAQGVFILENEDVPSKNNRKEGGIPFLLRWSIFRGLFLPPLKTNMIFLEHVHF